MPNIKAFRPLVHEKKIFEHLTKFSLFCPLLGPKSVICKSKEKVQTKCPNDYQLPVYQQIKGKGGHIGFLIHMKSNNT